MCLAPLSDTRSDAQPCPRRNPPPPVLRQPGIRIQKIFVRRALGQLAKQKLHRYPRATDHRLTLHNFRVDLDSVIHKKSPDSNPDNIPAISNHTFFGDNILAFPD